MNTLRGCRALALFSSAGFLAVPALAQLAPAPDAGEPPYVQDELRRDPEARIDGPRLVSPARNFSPRGPGLERQVNINAQGLNIVGDAANEPSIAVDPSAPNRIAIGWRQFDSIASNFREAGYAWSNDGGRTWTAGTIDNGIFRSDPVLGADSNGVFYYNSLSTSPGFETRVFVSGDGGKTWPSGFYAYGGDKQWFAIDLSGGPGNNFQHQSWSTAAGCCGSRIYTRSTDGGVTWMNPITLPQNAVFGTQTVGPSGELYIAGINAPTTSNTNFRVLKSTNANQAGVTPTFTSSSPNFNGALSFGISPNPGGLGGQVWVDVDRSNGPRRGWVYVVATINPATPDDGDIRFVRSSDGGTTWSAPVTINTDVSTSNYQWFGAMSVAPNGRIDVTWNDTRDSGVANLSRLYYSFSNDGGTTWSSNAALGPLFDSTVGWPNQNKIGDYTHMRSDNVGAFLAYTATYNGEEDVYFRRIGDYDCNGNGIGDTDDIAAGVRDCNENGIPDSCEIAAGTLRSADFNHDDQVDFFDYLDFVQAFADNNPTADFNGDSQVDFFDYLDFAEAFSRGC
jgi:hypothetical protein